MPAALPELDKRDMTARTLFVRAESIDEETRSFEAVVASEEPTPVFDLRTFEVIDEVLRATGGNFPDTVPLLDNHNRMSTRDALGRAGEFRRKGSQWIGRGRLSDIESNGDIWQKISDRTIDAVSIGYQVRDFVDIPRGETKRVNGKSFTAGDRTLRITTDWAVHELSLTPIPADSSAKIRKQPQTTTIPNRSYFR